jgi:hypothetical protein
VEKPDTSPAGFNPPKVAPQSLAPIWYDTLSAAIKEQCALGDIDEPNIHGSILSTLNFRRIPSDEGRGSRFAPEKCKLSLRSHQNEANSLAILVFSRYFFLEPFLRHEQ